jgi:PAS domain-containing protein
MQAQQALVAETNFRRAMENSMLTGMRALDMQGRITYVNAAFCQMTSWSEAELVGRTPPFPTGPTPTANNWPRAWTTNCMADHAGRLPGSRQAQGRQPLRRAPLRLAAGGRPRATRPAG